ncbi:MAG: hypothetical protein JST92_00375 [Deltaproteobacteria bacterium]|nr:hypothetical protein [Deltaproteobacteria bacterium]
MSDKHDRFRRLERPRDSGEIPKAPQVTANRFSGEPPPAPGPDADPEALSTRLRAERQSQLASGVQLDERSDDEQPFVRCAKCETDSVRGAVKCQVCGSRLDSEEMRAFNRAWWEKRKTELAAEKAEVDRLHAASLADRGSPLANQRALGMALAEEVAQRERSRLWWMSDSDEDDIDFTPLALRLLGRIDDERIRMGAIVGSIATAVALGFAAFGGGHPRPLPTVLFMAFVFLFLPRRKWNSRRWW